MTNLKCPECGNEWPHEHGPEGCKHADAHKCAKCGAYQFFTGPTPDVDVTKAINRLLGQVHETQKFPDPEDFLSWVPKEKRTDLAAAMGGVLANMLPPDAVKEAMSCLLMLILGEAIGETIEKLGGKLEMVKVENVSEHTPHRVLH